MYLITPESVAVLVAGGLLAGLVGAVTGLGGGVVVVPMLTLFFGLPVTQAVGVSLIAVIATSTGAAPKFIRSGLANMRVGLVLQVAASAGAIAGAMLSVHIAARWLFLLFGAILIYAAVNSLGVIPAGDAVSPSSSGMARKLRLAGHFQAAADESDYGVTGVRVGLAIMALAGLLSALLGIGAGAFKVLAMDRVMKLPFKVSTATSNFMIGVTAATSAGFYLAHGDTPPLVSGPVVIGVLTGATVGASLLLRLPVRVLRYIFAVLLIVVAAQMLLKGFSP